MTRRHPLSAKPIQLHVIHVSPVDWPAGGHVVAFTATGATSHLEVRKILKSVFAENALIRRFCARRCDGEFALFPGAQTPTVGATLPEQEEGQGTGQGIGEGTANAHNFAFCSKTTV